MCAPVLGLLEDRIDGEGAHLSLAEVRPGQRGGGAEKRPSAASRPRARAIDSGGALARALAGGRGGCPPVGTGQQKKWFAMHAFRGAVAFPRGLFAGALAPGEQADLRVLADRARRGQLM